MFTGIIEEVGTVVSVSSNKITIQCIKVLKNTEIGDSISVNGVCLTVTSINKDSFCADISPETLRVTTLKNLRNSSIVNLERALTLSSRLGGHFVSGHIDTVGKVSKISKFSDFYEISISFNTGFHKYFVKKGSISINGISLTIANCGDNFVTLAIIPHTYNMTVLKDTAVGDEVNIEFDILSKYVEKNLYSRDNNNVTIDLLAENGFI